MILFNIIDYSSPKQRKKMKASELTTAVRSTIGSPFHHGGRVNQVGLDCGGMMVVALRSLGIEVEDKEHYDRGDGLRDMVELLEANHFTQHPERHGKPENGDLILIRSSAIYHHLVYYTESDTIIHAWFTTGVNKVVESTMLPEWWDNIHSVWRLEGLEEG